MWYTDDPQEQQIAVLHSYQNIGPIIVIINYNIYNYDHGGIIARLLHIWLYVI